MFFGTPSRTQGLSKNVSNVIDLYHNKIKKIEVGGVKPDVRLNRVKFQQIIMH